MEYKLLQYQKDILEKGTPKPLNLVHGEEEYLIKTLTEKLRSIYGENFTLRWGDELTLESLQEITSEGSMFATVKERVVLIREFDEFVNRLGRKKKTLETLSTTLRTLKGSKLYAVVGRKLSSQDMAKEPFKTFAAHGDVISADRLPIKKVMDIVKRKLEKEAKGIEDDALKALVDMCQGNLMVLKNESEKLISFAGGRKITKEDVLKVCVPWGDSSLFDFIDSFFSKDIKACLSSMRENLSKGVSPLQIMGMLFSYTSKMYVAHSLLKEGETLERALEKAGVKHRFTKLKFKGYMEKFSLEDTRKLIESLYRLDRSIKLYFGEPQSQLLKFTTDFMLR